MILLAVLLQAQPAGPPAAQPDRWSILVGNGCGQSSGGQEVVVCGNAPSQRLPLPDEAVSTRPVASNPDLRATRVLDMEQTLCSSRQAGCQVGFGPPIVPILVGAAKLVKGAFARQPDRSGRVAIPLDDPAAAGVLLP